MKLGLKKSNNSKKNNPPEFKHKYSNKIPDNKNEDKNLTILPKKVDSNNSKKYNPPDFKHKYSNKISDNKNEDKNINNLPKKVDTNNSKKNNPPEFKYKYSNIISDNKYEDKNINNLPKKFDTNNSKKNNPPEFKYKYSNKIPDNKNEDKNTIYQKRTINNFISKKSNEKIIYEYQRRNDDKQLNNLPLFDKIVILQNLLKEMTSIKERFDDNKNKMIEKIYINCYNYFNDKVYMKEIFDYCISKKPEDHTDYQLIPKIQEYLDENIYKSLYDFFFLIRNNNNLMLKIINVSSQYIHEELSDFIVNFYYENIINSSFLQEELILLIYLLLEDLFLRIIPDNYGLDKNIDNIYTTYIKNHFVYYVFKSLSRKIDVRNFLYSILNDIIFRLESFRVPLSVDINIVNRFLRIEANFHHSFVRFAKGDDDNRKIQKTRIMFKNYLKNKITYNQGVNDKSSAFLKRTKKIELGSSNKSDKLGDSWTIIHSKLSQSRTLNDSNINLSLNNINDELNISLLNKSRTEDDNINAININENKNRASEKINQNKNRGSESLYIFKNKDTENLNLNLKIEEQPEEIDPFFEDNSVTLKYLNTKILDLRRSLNKNTINNAMKEFLKLLIYQIQNPEKLKNKTKNSNNYNFLEKDSSDKLYESIENNEENKDNEIFSTSLIIEGLKNMKEIKQVDSFKHLMRKIKINHKIVTRIITNIINKIKENLIYIPYILKFIMKMFDVLLEKKNKSSSNRIRLSYFNLYMFKINFLIGNIFLPIIKEPEYNGLVTNEIISQITNDNLKLITDIFNKALSGQLFNKNDDPYMTLFNQFIIEIMPKLFELIENIEKNIKIPKYIQKLINDAFNNEKNINYDFFGENQKENIQFQSICLSWKTIYIFLQIIEGNENILINDNNEIKIIFDKFLENKDKFNNLFTNGIKNKKCDFFFITKINYRNEFEQKLESIINDNFNLIIPKPNNDLITAYKKCLAEVFGYVNIINKVNFMPFTFRKDKEIYDKNIIRKISAYNRKKDYEKIIYNRNYLTNDNNKITINLQNMPLTVGDKEDADFKNSIFPQILDIIKYEISFNLDNEISQRIIFCCNYLKLYMRNIPNKYRINNFDLLFKELIKETQKNISYLKNNILFEYYLKIKEGEKLILMLSNYNSQIRNLEKIKCIEYLYNKLELPIKLNITKENGIITNIEYINNDNIENNILNKAESINIIDYLENRNQSIKNFIDEFPDFHLYEEQFDNILDIEEKAHAPEAINTYFKSLTNLLKKEKIINRFNKEEIENIIYDLENYILTKLYNKLFPYESTKDDIFFYKKCSRLSFIKPENIVTDKKLINENLIDKSIEYLNDIDDKLTPADKIKSFAKAIEIMQNSITFNTGRDELGVDDIIKPLIYVVIKSKPKNISSNLQYCELYLNSELSKKQYGVILAQIGLIIGIIKKMKYNDLIGVSEKEFGIDEIEEDNDVIDENEKEGK